MACTLVIVVALIPIMRFYNDPVCLFASSALAWAIFSLAYTIAGMHFVNLESPPGEVAIRSVDPGRGNLRRSVGGHLGDWHAFPRCALRFPFAAAYATTSTAPLKAWPVGPLRDETNPPDGSRFRGTGYWVAMGLYVVPRRVGIRRQPLCIRFAPALLTMTVDPSWAAMMLVVAPLNSLLYGIVGLVLSLVPGGFESATGPR